MAYNYSDLDRSITGGLARWQKPVKNYNQELQRRGFYQDWTQLQQQLRAADFARQAEARNVAGGVVSQGLGLGNVRGSYTRDAYGQGMGDVRRAYEQRLQGIGNSMAAMQNSEYAYLNRPRGGKPAEPAPFQLADPTASPYYSPSGHAQALHIAIDSNAPYTPPNAPQEAPPPNQAPVDWMGRPRRPGVLYDETGHPIR